MDLETQKVFTRLCLSADDSSQPRPGHPRGILYTDFNAAGDSLKFKILFALLLDIERRLACMFQATRGVAAETAFDDSVTAEDVMADRIKDQEDRLESADSDWNNIIDVLIDILDHDVASAEVLNDRMTLLDGFLDSH